MVIYFCGFGETILKILSFVIELVNYQSGWWNNWQWAGTIYHSQIRKSLDSYSLKIIGGVNLLLLRNSSPHESRFLQMEAVASTFQQLWRTTNGFRLRNQGNNIVLFVFNNLVDIDKILKSQPWSFDRFTHHATIYRRCTRAWARFQQSTILGSSPQHPTSFLTRKVGENLFEIVGDIQRSNGAVDEDGGSFFRVRVMLDVTLPLCRGRVITLTSGEKRWIKFKYEWLPSLCYWCGCLNHYDRDYELWVQSKGILTLDQQQFGPFLRAPPYKSSGKDVIYVPGYYEKRASRL